MKYQLTLLVFISFVSGFAQDIQELLPVKNVESVHQHSWGMGISFSTFGPGIFVTYKLGKRIKIKGSGNYFYYDYSLNKLMSELEGQAKLRVGGLGLFTDWHFLKFAYLSAGASTNFNSVDVDGKMAESIMIGDIEMTPDEIGKVKIGIKPSWAISPYIGMGIGNRISGKRRIRFSCEIGTFFQGAPNVNLNATGMLTPTGSKEQEEIIESNIKPIDFWPKLAINVTYNIK